MWHFGLKWWRIEAFINTCLSLVNTSLALKVKKPGSAFIFLELRGKSWFLDFTKILDLVIFAWFFPFIEFIWLVILLSSPTLLPPVLASISLSFIADLVFSVVFSIKINDTTIWLKPWMNCQ